MPSARRPRDSESSRADSLSTQRRKWIWYRDDGSGKAPVCKKEFDALPAVGKGRLLQVIDRYLDGQSRRHDVDHLGNGIYELRTRVGNNHFRVLFSLWGPNCVGLTAFYKNQQATPKIDKDRAEKRRDQWELMYGKHP